VARALWPDAAYCYICGNVAWSGGRYIGHTGELRKMDEPGTSAEFWLGGVNALLPPEAKKIFKI